MQPSLQLVRRAFPGRPAFDTAVSRALLQHVAEGRAPETLRLYRPDDVLAFSVVDATRAGFARAVEAARRAGFAAMLRLAGGRAAVFHAETLAFAWSIPAPDARRGIGQRFDALAGLVARALRRLGVDARVGEVPREYCPGAHSVNARGRRKLMGVGQRVIRGAAHVGGVIVVRDAERAREALVPVYDALGFDFDPDTVGSVEDEVRGVSSGEVAAALLAELGRERSLRESGLAEETLALAVGFEARHRVAAPAQCAAATSGVGEGRRGAKSLEELSP